MKHTLLAITAALALAACTDTHKYAIITPDGTIHTNTHPPAKYTYNATCQRGPMEHIPIINHDTDRADGVSEQDAQNTCDVSVR